MRPVDRGRGDWLCGRYSCAGGRGRQHRIHRSGARFVFCFDMLSAYLILWFAMSSIFFRIAIPYLLLFMYLIVSLFFCCYHSVRTNLEICFSYFTISFLICCLGHVGFGEFDSQFGDTALIRAAWHGHAECVRLLIDAGADKDAKSNVRHWSHYCWGILRFQSLCVLCQYSPS
jgi:hypothetical protein